MWGHLSRELDGYTCSHIRVFTLSLSGAWGVSRHEEATGGLGRSGTGDVKELSALAQSVEIACAKCEIPEEKRPFSAHITLGRLKVPTVLDLDNSSLTGKFTVSEVLLIRSELLPGGPRYTVLHRSSLESKGG